MIKSPLWQNSICDSGMWLHDWLVLRPLEGGLEEYCYRCGKTKLFIPNEPNELYLGHHLRLSLQPSTMPKEFYVEYPKSL